MTNKIVNQKVMHHSFFENGKEYIFTAFFTLQDLGQGAYFSVTGELRKKGYDDCESCGMMHEEVKHYFPHMEKYLKWHLVNWNSGPMHYIANSLYWAGFTKWTAANWDNFNSTCVFGSVDSDFSYNVESMTKDEVVTWLNNRYAKLMDAFYSDMEELFMS